MPCPRLKMCPGRPLRSSQNLLYPQLQNLQRRKQRNWIKVALHRMPVPHGLQPSSSGCRQSRPNHIRARRRHLASSPAVSTPK